MKRKWRWVVWDESNIFLNCYVIQILRIANDSKASHEERANTMEKQMEIMRKQVNHHNIKWSFSIAFSARNQPTIGQFRTTPHPKSSHFPWKWSESLSNTIEAGKRTSRWNCRRIACNQGWTMLSGTLPLKKENDWEIDEVWNGMRIWERNEGERMNWGGKHNIFLIICLCYFYSCIL